MHKYVFKRLIAIIPMILLIILIVFFILNITPGDPAEIILGKDAPPEAVEQLREELGLDDPFFQRYFNYVINAIQFDFGYSYRTGDPVFNEILPVFPVTLTLAISAIAVCAIIGIPLGILSAVRQYSKLDISLTVSSLIIASVPGFWLSLMLILLFSSILKILPSSGIGGIDHYILPVVTMALPSAALMARITRNQMLETMRQDYIRTAKAKGASKQRIIWKHAIKNALMPVITMLGMSFAGLLGGSMITELVFGLPGVGTVIITAIRMKDIPIVMGSTIFLATLFMIIMLIVDLIYAYLDPRIKAQFSR